MLLGTLIISLISLGLIINRIFEIKCSCKVRGMQQQDQDTDDSESSEEMYTNNQNSSDSDEIERTPIENNCNCCTKETQNESCDNCKCDRPLTDCSRACSCHDLNNKASEDTDDDIPPLIPVSHTVEDNEVSTNTESPDQGKINNLREQIIN